MRQISDSASLYGLRSQTRAIHGTELSTGNRSLGLVALNDAKADLQSVDEVELRAASEISY